MLYKLCQGWMWLNVIRDPHKGRAIGKDQLVISFNSLLCMYNKANTGADK